MIVCDATRLAMPSAYRAACTAGTREIVGRNSARDLEAFGYDS